jgi:drug/metabolite transporter (DMT)-like permease
MVFFRCAAGAAVMAPFALRAGAAVWKVKRPGKVLERCCYSTGGFFLGFYAFAHLPLADAQAISFTRTLFIVILAVWILKEQVAWRRWTAVGVGFLGVLLMLRPGGAAFEAAGLAALASSFLFAMTIVTVKDLTRDHSTIQLVLYTNVFTTVAGLPFAFFGWQDPAPLHWLWFAILGLTGVGAQSCYVRALGTGDASLMGLVDYVRLPLAMGIGFWVFAELPDALGMAGAAVIIGSTAYITWREAATKAERPKVAPEA